MTDFRDLSRLPADERYWKALEERIVGQLGPRVRSVRKAGTGSWEPLTRHAWSLGMLAGAAGLAALLVLPPREAERPANRAGLLRLPEDDPALAAVLSAPAPPPLAWLVIPHVAGAER